MRFIALSCATALCFFLTGCPSEPLTLLEAEELGDATAGASYSMALTARGGKAPYTFDAAGLPGGLQLDAATGLISGAPSSAGDFQVTLAVTDSNRARVSRAYAMKIYEAPRLARSELPDAVAGQPYSQRIEVLGGKGPFTFALRSSAAPPWLSLDAATGTLSGTPAGEPGSFELMIQIADAHGATLQGTVRGTLVWALAIASSRLGDGYVGEPYSDVLVPRGGKPPFRWTVTAATAPAGLALNEAGTFSGTPATPGHFTLEVRVTDGSAQAAQGNVEIEVLRAPEIASSVLPDAYLGEAYAAALLATGGKPPVLFSASPGALPPGLALSSAGQLSGTPTQPGDVTFDVTLTDANGRSAVASVSHSTRRALAITTTSLADAYRGVAYSQQLTATGGKAPLTWSVTAGALPAGLELAATGLLSGVATASGTFPFTVTVTDANRKTASAALQLAAYELPAIATPAYPSGYAGEPYAATTEVTGGKAPFTWSVTSGTLPTGVTLDPATGGLNGTPTAAETARFSLTVTDANGQVAVGAMTLSVLSLPVITTPSPLPDGYAGDPYSVTMAVAGGLEPFTWSVDSGTLPLGLSLLESGALGPSIDGGLANAQAHAFTVRVRDAHGKTATKSFDLTTYRAPVVESAPLTQATEGVTYRAAPGASERIQASSGKPPYTYAVTGLPPGLSLASGTGVLDGIPSPGSAGEHTLQATVTDANGKAGSSAFSLRVAAPRPIFGGGTAGVAPTGSPITDALTVFAVSRYSHRPLPGIGVRLRKNGVEYSPPREALTGPDGKAYFTSLGLNGTTDTLDVTANGKDHISFTLFQVNASLVTLPLDPSGVPMIRSYAVSAYDPVRQRVLVTGGIASTVTGCQDTVEELADLTVNRWEEAVLPGMPGSMPSQYYAAGAVADGKLVVFGGYTCRQNLGSDDTWQFDLGTRVWERIPSDGPGAVNEAVMTRDETGRSTLMFGGYDQAGFITSALWRYSPAARHWTRLAPTGTEPLARYLHGGAFDTSANLMWICGGTGDISEFADCWTYSPASNAWLPAPPLPEPRKDLAMAYDPVAHELYAFGGSSGGAYRTDLLVLRGGSWVTAAPQGSVPQMVDSFGALLEFDTASGRLVLVGGAMESTAGVWSFAPSTGTWTHHNPPPEVGHTVTLDISGAAATPDSTVYVTWSAPSGFSGSAVAYRTLTGSLGVRIPNVPEGETLSVYAVDLDFSRSLATRVWSQVDGGPVGPVTSDLTASMTLPAGPLPVQSSTATLVLPAGWTASFGSASTYLQRPGARWARSGVGRVSTTTGVATFYYLAPPAGMAQVGNIQVQAQSPGACGYSIERPPLTPGPIGTVAMRRGPQGLSPGNDECTGSYPTAAEGTYAFTAPAGTGMLQLSRGPFENESDWQGWMPGASGEVSFTIPALSTLAPSRPAPSGQNVGWRATSVFFGSQPFQYNDFKAAFARGDAEAGPMFYGFFRQ